MKIFKKIIYIAFLLMVLFILYRFNTYRFMHPEMTETQLFLNTFEIIKGE
jgi:hypothetical protein